MSKRIIPEIEGYTKIQVVSFVKVKIRTDPEWARRACLSLYEQQTDKERKSHVSHGHNNVGFGRLDSPLLTHIACKLRQNRAVLDDIKILQIKLPRYASQLICIADSKDRCKKLKKQLDIYYCNNSTNMPF